LKFNFQAKASIVDDRTSFTFMFGLLNNILNSLNLLRVLALIQPFVLQKSRKKAPILTKINNCRGDRPSGRPEGFSTIAVYRKNSMGGLEKNHPTIL
jgi:hypothetical protein